MKGTVYICHHVDTEGPLYESLEDLFWRIKLICDIDLLPTSENLEKLQNGLIDVDKAKQIELKSIIDPHSINFLGDWGQIDSMLDKILKPQFRNKLVGSDGLGWIYNWHIMDHVGFTGLNPRNRDLGYLRVFNFYEEKLRTLGCTQDKLHWHFHPVSFFKDAHIPATSYDNSMHEIHQIITRRVIEKEWFPIVNRAGFHTVRFDSNIFLEQWIPFDPSNQAVSFDNEPKQQKDLINGRFGDWRTSPTDWRIYNPSYRDWRKIGGMNRYIARVLNMKSRHRNINREEIKSAFKMAKAGENVYLGVTNHDWRDMSVEIDDFRSLLADVIIEYPNVNYVFSDSVSAFRKVLFKDDQFDIKRIKLKTWMESNRLFVKVVNGETFGPQPYLAIKTTDEKYFHDNFDFVENASNFFSYTFDEYTLDIKKVSKIGVASNDRFGNQSIEILNLFP